MYEIAKEIGIPNKDLIAKIRALGLEVNNHMSSLDADDVARIKRSLEKEKASVAAPAQTQKLSSGTVLRRRSSGEKSANDAVPEEVSPQRAAADRIAAERAAAAAAPAPVVRRRAVADGSGPSDSAPAPEPRRAAPPVEAPPVAARPVEPVRKAPEPEPEPAPIATKAPVEVATPTPIVAAVEPPPVAVTPPAPAEPVRVAPPARVEAPVVAEPPPSQPIQQNKPAAVVNDRVPERAAVQPRATNGSEPHRPEAPRAEQPATATAQPRSRVILEGPRVVQRGANEPGSRAGMGGGDRVIQSASGVTTQVTSRPSGMPERGMDRGIDRNVDRNAEPPASTPLPARVRGNPSDQAPRVPRTVEEVAGGARSRFEMELERARARTAERPASEMVVEAEAPPEAAPLAPRDPSRPAVGTVISLPPRIKITERTPMAGRPAPGPQPVNPIRGRFAQQQQRGGPRGPGGRPGPGNDFGRKKLPLGKKGQKTTLTTPAEHKRVIRIEDTITVADLARGMGVKAPEVLKKLWGMGMTGVNINASIDFDTAQLLAGEFAYEVQNVAFKEDDIFINKADDSEKLELRAPVVTVMGHVDHGKTSLLDAIRKARVAAGEAGGITQHVAAYKINAPGHGDIVFLDTPGHEAFTEMRARGAQATDIVILVVAANDGVMPQTLEALAHAKDANVKIIVAVNKIDMHDAAPDRVRQQLADHGLIAEEWGGDTIYVNVSALKGTNIDQLLAQIAVQAEVLELRANPDKAASGVVIEARLDRNRGPMATILIQEGTLHVGDILVAGRTFGKVRAMLDDRGNNLEQAGPSTPIEVLGLDGVPDAGDQVNAAEDDKVAKQVVEHRRQSFRKRELGSKARVSLEGMMERNSVNASKELKIVLKADVQGSAEALKAALTKLSTEKVRVVVTMAGVGGITESDVNFAKAGGAIILGFHVRPAGKSTKLAEQEDVEIRLYDIIYDALDEVKAAMAGLLAPIKREIPMGKAQVRATFSIPKIGTVAGCMVTEGKITRKAHLRIIRDAVQVYEGKVGSLRRVKDDVSEVQNGYECGVMVAGWNEVKEGDIIEAYEVIEEAAQL
ncbi:MAG: translation initiation factor IF-2 [Kofleriaceae bacterium]